MPSAHDADEANDAGPTAPEVRAALRALHAEAAELSDVFLLARASRRRSVSLLPEEVLRALAAEAEISGDLANGGADQVVWNRGPEFSRELAAALDRVGAIENAELLTRLADALQAYRGEVDDEAIAADPVSRFMEYRRRVGGPFFRIPEPRDELGEALLEHVYAHRDALPDPDGKLPGFE